MLIVGDMVFLDQFWMRTSKKYVSNFFEQLFKVKCQGQSSKSLKCLVWTWNKLHLIRNSIFWVKYNQSVNFIHKDLVFFTLKFKSEVNKYILNKGQRSNK